MIKIATVSRGHRSIGCVDACRTRRERTQGFVLESCAQLVITVLAVSCLKHSAFILPKESVSSRKLYIP
jgi:hypothetical protein